MIHNSNIFKTLNLCAVKSLIDLPRDLQSFCVEEMLHRLIFQKNKSRTRFKHFVSSFIHYYMIVSIISNVMLINHYYIPYL